VLEQIRRYTRFDTTVKLMVYYRYSWKVLSVLVTRGTFRPWRLPEVVAQHSEAQTGCPITYTYTRLEARRLIENHGLRVTQTSVEHIFPYRIKEYVQYRYVKEWYFRLMPQPVFRWLERRFGWHLCLTALPSRVGDEP
jgi:hypothetical protein